MFHTMDHHVYSSIQRGMYGMAKNWGRGQLSLPFVGRAQQMRVKLGISKCLSIKNPGGRKRLVTDSIIYIIGCNVCPCNPTC